MDTIFETVLNFIIEVIKLIFYVLIWSYILFFIGVLVLKIFTLFRYPTGIQYEKHLNIISGVGLNTIYVFWSCIATYNFSENIYFLIAGVVIATLQVLFIALKYYSQDKNQYEL